MKVNIKKYWCNRFRTTVTKCFIDIIDNFGKKMTTLSKERQENLAENVVQDILRGLEVVLKEL